MDTAKTFSGIYFSILFLGIFTSTCPLASDGEAEWLQNRNRPDFAPAATRGTPQHLVSCTETWQTQN